MHGPFSTILFEVHRQRVCFDLCLTPVVPFTSKLRSSGGCTTTRRGGAMLCMFDKVPKCEGTNLP